MMVTHLVSYLRLFSDISEKDEALITEAFESRVYSEGNSLFKSGNICKEMFFICKGVLKIIISDDKGKQITHFFLKENQFCTILRSFTNQTNADEEIVAACDVEVLAISKVRLLILYENLPYFKNLIDYITQQALLDKVELRNSYLGLDSSSRYRLFLTQQADIALRVSLADVASYLGITQQSLSRIRRKLC
ncbi:Crp/Fnr family transcriptional regulator [Mucilaginibacter sp. CSA2-8R]|uniref:Crp/Fnr family transcriptional regulator n=1 Tax=Mucilaginibacter sp. CSA2-8R TaxID=3141542 RepID=UPI00315D78BE